MAQVDTCVLGAGMYPGYEQYWSAVLEAPNAPLPFSGKAATAGEIDYARWAHETPHIVLSKSMQSATWEATRIVGEFDAIAQLKQQPGKDICAIGGARFVSGLIERGLVDELRLAIHPVLLGRGKALFKESPQRHTLTLAQTRPLSSGAVELTHRLAPVR